MLTRNGYGGAAITAQFNCKPSNLRDYLAGTPDPENARELTDKRR